MVERTGGNTFSSWEWVSRYTVKKHMRFGQHTFLDYSLGLSLGLYLKFSIADLGGEGADGCPYVEEGLDTLGILCRLQRAQRSVSEIVDSKCLPSCAAVCPRLRRYQMGIW